MVLSGRPLEPAATHEGHALGQVADRTCIVRRTGKMTKIYVGNLPWSATEDEVREFFSAFGQVHSVSIITDRDTGQSKGFGFIEMEDADARAAIEQGDGKEFGGRTIRVNEAREKPRRSGRRR
jgi:RNA recognition motif-containing protein